MAFLARAIPYIAKAAPYVQAYGAYKQYTSQKKAGKAAERDAQLVAAQQKAQGLASQAEAQREALTETRKARYAQSRARAVAAASGAGANDPTVENLINDIGDEGEYNKLAALYSGDSDRKLADYASGATRNQGRARRRAYDLDARTTLLDGALSLSDRYF